MPKEAREEGRPSQLTRYVDAGRCSDVRRLAHWGASVGGAARCARHGVPEVLLEPAEQGPHRVEHLLPVAVTVGCHSDVLVPRLGGGRRTKRWKGKCQKGCFAQVCVFPSLWIRSAFWALAFGVGASNHVDTATWLLGILVP